MLLGALNESLDRFAAVPYARADLYKVWWLAKESAASNGRYRNFQEASHFVLGQQFLHWIC